LISTDKAVRKGKSVGELVALMVRNTVANRRRTFKVVLFGPGTFLTNGAEEYAANFP
jgi:hypothetical protein